MKLNIFTFSSTEIILKNFLALKIYFDKIIDKR